MKFKKRIYKNPKDFLSDLWYATRNIRRMKEAQDKGLLPFSFRERLMLAVTSVNGCRYCTYFHTRVAVKSGISQAEIKQLLDKDVAGCPEEEALAVIYAQHWAESNACPDPEAVRKLQQTYGDAKAEAIHLALRMIRLGNLSGNSWDYLLYRLSFGKYGV